MIVGIVGSRDFTDYAYFTKIVSVIPISLIVSGGAIGADSLAERYSIELNIPLVKHKPNWDMFGKAAGMIRNKLIVDQSELVIAVWDDKSRGTKHLIDITTKANKKLIIVHYPTKLIDFINMGDLK